MTREEKLATAKKMAEEKAQSLSEELKTKVHPLVFMSPKDEEAIVGFIREPNRTVKLAVMDKFHTGFYSACAQALDACLIKEHSDARIYSARGEDDIYNLGAVNELSEMIQYAANHEKKRN